LVMSKLKLEFEAIASKHADVTLNMAKTEFIDSSGIGGIVFLYKRLTAEGFSLKIAGAKDQPLNLLKHLRLTELLAA
jgi:anti-anti-sigma factor